MRFRKIFSKTSPAFRSKEQVPFEYRVGWCERYDELFRSEFVEETDIERLIVEARKVGRVLLTGRGGSGKTTILNRLSESSFGRETFAIFLDLKKWSSRDSARWQQMGQMSTDLLDYLIRFFSRAELSLARVDAFDVSIQKTLLVDGLNEVPNEVGNAILTAADEFASVIPQGSVIVADRLVRRPLGTSSRWKFARVLPLTDEQVKGILSRDPARLSVFEQASESKKELWKIPLFLNDLLRVSYAEGGQLGTFRQFFTDHVSLTDPELTSLRKAAFHLYEHGSRSFSLARLRELVDENVCRKLLDSGAIEQSGGQARFFHHLKHDYLAATWVCDRPDLWNDGTFNVLTYNASSFDTIALMLEGLAEENADSFLRAVYDWNPYASAYALGEVTSRGDAQINKDMIFVMCAMLAEKMWDRVLPTARKAKDSLALLPFPMLRAFEQAENLDGVLTIVGQRKGDSDWFSEWKSLFTLPEREIANDDQIAYLNSEDSVLGWTASNVLKRIQLQPHHDQMLRDYLNSESMQVRWRAVHVLGARPNRDNMSALGRVLHEDIDEWVKYGAIRSLVEMASIADEDLRLDIFTLVQGLIPQLKQSQRLIEEFSRAIFIREELAPNDWYSQVGRVVDQLRLSAGEPEEINRWLQISKRLEVYEAA